VKFFVYTLALGGNGPSPKFASASTVNAQPLREILSMMAVQDGKITLFLPRPDGTHLVQGGNAGFTVDEYHIVEDDLRSVVTLTALTPPEFRRLLALGKVWKSVGDMLYSAEYDVGKLRVQLAAEEDALAADRAKAQHKDA
jgi:hypothetical protein